MPDGEDDPLEFAHKWVASYDEREQVELDLGIEWLLHDQFEQWSDEHP
jgi:hypothetical protein